MHSIGQLIRIARKEARLTIGQLAEKCGIDRSNVSTAESGKYEASHQLIRRIVKPLGLDLEVYASHGPTGMQHIGTPASILRWACKEVLQCSTFKLAALSDRRPSQLYAIYRGDRCQTSTLRSIVSPDLGFFIGLRLIPLTPSSREDRIESASPSPEPDHSTHDNCPTSEGS